MIITRQSPFSGKTNSRNINITEDQLEQLKKGVGHIQHICSNISAQDREFILTGITPEEWDETFKDIEND